MQPKHRGDKYKIVLVGDSSVGKTCIFMRLVDNSFKTTLPTIGAVSRTIMFNIKEKQVQIDLWDTAGQEQYRSMVPMFYKNAHGALVIFDITSYKSFEGARAWVDELKMTNPFIPVAFLGNKLDKAHERKVTIQEAEEFATYNELYFSEISAMEGTRVHTSVLKLVEMIMKIQVNQTIDKENSTHLIKHTQSEIKRRQHPKRKCCNS